MKKWYCFFNLVIFFSSVCYGQQPGYGSIMMQGVDSSYHATIESLSYNNWANARRNTPVNCGLLQQKHVRLSASTIALPAGVKCKKAAQRYQHYSNRRYTYKGWMPQLNIHVLKAGKPANPLMPYYLADGNDGRITDSSALPPQGYKSTCLLKVSSEWVPAINVHYAGTASSPGYCDPVPAHLSTTLYLKKIIAGTEEDLQLITGDWIPGDALLVAEDELWLKVRKAYKPEDGAKKAVASEYHYLKIILPQ